MKMLDNQIFAVRATFGLPAELDFATLNNPSRSLCSEKLIVSQK